MIQCKKQVCDMLYFLYGFILWFFCLVFFLLVKLFQEFPSHNKSHAKWQITKKNLGRAAKDENALFPHMKRFLF